MPAKKRRAIRSGKRRKVKRPLRRKKSQPRKVKPPVKPKKVKRKTLDERIAERLFLQRQEEIEEKLHQKAKSSVSKFRPRKSDRGKIVFVGVDGKRAKGNRRKGYAVQVGKTGKKRLLKSKDSWRPRKRNDVELPYTRQTKKAVKQFQAARRDLLKSGEGLVKGSGSINITGVNDFSEKVSATLAKSIKRTLERQASQRQFLITALVLVEKPDGTRKTYEVQVSIAKADHIAIKLAGIENFVRMKFYAFMAKELAFDGYVSSGSANHIRRLEENRGVEREEWTKDGELWEGHDYETVKIRRLEWKIEQLI